jgi:zinc/manganese transport system substrate-binding protein
VKTLLPATALLFVVAACGDGADPTDRVQVVATTTILGDVARNVVGADGTVEVLLPLAADPHDYRPSSRQVAAVDRADLVVAIGLGLEEGLTDVLGSDNVVELAERLDPLDDDPHVWLDPVRMAEAGRLIAAELAAIDPSRDWMARAEAYAAELFAADEQIGAILDAVPVDRRKLVTNHDALEYFATRYGFEVVGVVTPGGATLAEPSSARLSDLVEILEREAVPAIFAETTESTTLADAVAAEAGRDVTVVELFTGSLGGPGSGAETLIEMLITDAERVAAALT